MRKVGTKLALLEILLVALMTIGIVAMMFFSNKGVINDIIEEDVKQAYVALSTQIEDYKAQSAELAGLMAQSAEVRKAVADGDKEEIIRTCNVVASERAYGTDFVTIADASGIVLARTHSDKTGDDVTGQQNISEALKGNAGTYIEPGTEVKLSVRTGAPIYDGSKLVGVISTGYRLDEADYVDSLKQLTGAEFTIFLGDERINTTIEQNGERAIGTKLDPAIADIVIKQGEEYLGRAKILGAMHSTYYVPIRDADNNVIGIYFAGKTLEKIYAAERTGMLLALGASAVLLIGLMLFTFMLANRMITKPLGKMRNAARDLASGRLDTSIDVSTKDELGDLANDLRATIDTLKLYIGDISHQLSLMAKGDMTSVITQDYVGDFAPIKQALLAISDGLNETLGAINVSAEQVNSGAEQVSAGAQALSQGATEQASAIEELSASIMEVSDKITATAQNVQQAAAFMHKSEEGVQRGAAHMQEMLEAMDRIGSSSAEIAKIIKVIDDIAFQTNILALNAAVEAARAGAAGKGFAVVADEVRNLASKSADAAKQTTALIEGSVASVEEGARIARETARALEDVREQTVQVGASIREIDQASDEQAMAISQITMGVEQISTVVQTNSATAEESAAAAEELSGQSAMLSEEVARFQLRQ